MTIYLDNAATTKPYDEVVDGMVDILKNSYGNPSSLHQLGFDAEKHLKESKNQIAKLLKVQAKEIVFTSGGTESNNLAILGSCRASIRRGKHIITSSIEHPSVLKVFEYLRDEEGYELTLIPVDSNGLIDVEYLYSQIRKDTVFVSLMHVNNETGTIQPIEEIGPRLKDLNERIIFHVDGVQSFGKHSINLTKSRIDLFSVSAHKIHGPKGVGFLYVNSKANIKPIVYGGAQQYGIRSGTENIPGIVGMRIAIEKVYKNLESNRGHIKGLKEQLLNQIISVIPDVVVNGSSELTANNILNISFIDVKSEVLLHSIEAKEIYVSSGSACSSNKPEKSHVLKAMGKENAVIDGAIRFSFSEFNTEEDINICFEELKKTVPMLRRFVRK